MQKLYVLGILIIIGLIQPVFAQITFSGKIDSTTGSNPYAVSIGDLNGDGKPDIAVANYTSNTVSVYLNATSPGSTSPIFSTRANFNASSNPYFVSIGDLNGDGRQDLAVANFGSASVSVLLNTTTPGAVTPSFSAKTDFATDDLPSFVSIGDLNNDGRPDLAAANYGTNTISVLLNTTVPGAMTPSFSAKTNFTTGGLPNSVSISDFNGDGKLDLAVANSGSNNISVILNTTTPGAAVPAFTAKTDFSSGSIPYSVSIDDLNGDGRPDLVTANYNENTVSVLLNATTPGAVIPAFLTKSDFVTGGHPAFVFIGDVNADGKPDLAVANQSADSISILLNLTVPGAVIPSFSIKNDFAVGDGPYCVSIGDLNGDCRPDLAAANFGSNTVSVLLNTTVVGVATPAFSANIDSTAGINPNSVAIDDLNGDGKKDLAVANFGELSVSVLFNITNPGAAVPIFTEKTDFTTGAGPACISINDFNSDGRDDIAAVNYGSVSVSVLMNTTNPGAALPAFSDKTDFAVGANPYSVSSGDLNGDGKPDLAVVNSGSSSVSILMNTTAPGAATPTFTTSVDFATANNPSFSAIGDLNGDGKLDLAVANSGSSNVSVFLNTTTPGDTTPSFSAKTDFGTGTYPYSVSIGDLNGNGKPDLAVANYSSNAVSILLNTTAPGAVTPSFSAKTDFSVGDNSYSLALGDLSGDGKLDLAVAKYNSASVSILLNITTPGAAAPAFSTMVDFTTGMNPISIAIDDLNGDGKPDLAVADYNYRYVSILLNEAILTPVGVEFESGLTPETYGLAQNYPNPFNPSTKISFKLANREHAKLAVYNLLGQQVWILFNGIAEKEREYDFDFDASHLAGGVYFYKMQTPTKTEVRKMMLLK